MTNTIAVEHSSEKQSKVFKIEWNIGKRCNFNCSYCDDYTHDNFSKHLSLEIAKKTICRHKYLQLCSNYLHARHALMNYIDFVTRM